MRSPKTLSRRSGALSILLLMGLVLGSAVVRIGPGQPARAAPAAALPTFGVGLGAQPSNDGIYGYMPDSGIPWSYAYVYLPGGVNTPCCSGWETYNANGQYPLFYAQGASANGYIPVFTYYEVVQSLGSCNACSESRRALSNLNNNSTSTWCKRACRVG
jgi:hypothetical protein